MRKCSSLQKNSSLGMQKELGKLNIAILQPLMMQWIQVMTIID